VGARKKHPAGQDTSKARQSTATNTMNTSKGRAPSTGAYLEQKNVKAPEENQEAADSPSSQEQPRSERTEATAPEKKAEATSARADKRESPAPPPQTPRKTRILPERQQAGSFANTPPAPAAHTPGPTQPSDPTAALANLGWMPPAEDQVARFLSDVADIAPPPVRGREDTGPHFVLPAAISPEEAQRKKAKADPFWSQVVATPMEQPEPVAPTRPRPTRKRSRIRGRTRWLLVSGGIVLLVVIGVGVAVFLYPGLLSFK
jgi:hypothetical protein